MKKKSTLREGIWFPSRMPAGRGAKAYSIDNRTKNTLLKTPVFFCFHAVWGMISFPHACRYMEVKSIPHRKLEKKILT